MQLTFDVARSPSIPTLLRSRAVERLGPRLVDGCLVVSSSEQRSQLQNREAAERKLVDILRTATAPPPRKRRPTKPSRASVDRRIKEKKNRGETKRLRRSRDSD